MRTKQLMAAVLILAAGTSIAQTVAGSITDPQGKPIPFIAVGLIRLPDSTISKGVMTDGDGKYFIDRIDTGSFLVRIDVAGYSRCLSGIIKLNGKEDKLIPPLTLRPSDIRLDEITVSTLKKTVEFKNGNVTVNVENSPLASGNTVYDLLARLPGVTLDPINNVISIQGREGVRIFIDDRAQQLSGTQLINLLRSISASSVEKVEVLKNPPVRYDANGTAGIINIVTKTARLYGFSGQVSTAVSQGIYSRGETGFALNYKTKRFNIFANGNSEYGTWYSVNNFNRRISNEGRIATLDQRHTETDKCREADLNLGADWYLNKKTIIGIKVTLDPGDDLPIIDGNTFVSDSSSGYDRLNYKMASAGQWNYVNYNVNAEHRLDTTGGKILFSADYSPNVETTTTRFDNYFLTADKESLPATRYRVYDEERIMFYSAKLDVEKKIREGTELSGGAKTSNVDVLRNYNFYRRTETGDYIADTVLTNVFNYKENVAALYFQVEQEVGDISLQAGLRAEQTKLSAAVKEKDFKMKRDFFNLFPLFSAEYEASEKHNFQLSYNRRINRPEGYAYLPFRYFWVNALSSSGGNPNLLPEYSNTLEFTHVYKGSISSAFAYSRLSNYIMPYTIQDDSTNSITENFANIKHSTTAGYSLFFEVPLKKWWTASGNLNVSWNSYAGQLDGVQYASSGIGYAGSVANNFILPKQFRLEAEGQYIGPAPMGVFTIQPRWALNLALKKSFLKNDQLTVVLGVNDIFYTMVGRNQVRYQNQNWKISETNDSRRIRISLSWNFGKIRQQEEEERVISSNEELRDKLKH